MFNKKNNYNILLCAIIGACALFFGMPNPIYHLPFLVLFYPICLYIIALISPSAFRHAMLCGLFGVSASMYFISQTLYVYGNLPYILGIPCTMVFGAFIGFFSGVFAFAMKKAQVLPLSLRVLFAGLVWYICEELRSILFTGFPWLTLSSAFVPIPEYIQGASIVGAFALSGVFVSISVLCVESVRKKANSNVNINIFPLCTAFLMLSLLYFFGNERLKDADIKLECLEWNKSADYENQSPYILFPLTTIDKNQLNLIKQHQDPSYIGQASHLLVLPSFFLTHTTQNNSNNTDSNNNTNNFQTKRIQENFQDWLLFTAVQGNVSQSIKWDQAFQKATVLKYLRLSTEALHLTQDFLSKPHKATSYGHKEDTLYTSQPDTSQPDTSQPDTSQPDTSQPDTPLPSTSTLSQYIIKESPIFLWPETAIPFYFQTHSPLSTLILDFVKPNTFYAHKEQTKTMSTPQKTNSYLSPKLIFGGPGIKISTKDNNPIDNTFIYDPNVHIVDTYYNRLFFLESPYKHTSLHNEQNMGQNTKQSMKKERGQSTVQNGKKDINELEQAFGHEYKLSYYDKEHLVPFGEYLPEVPFLPKLFIDLLQGLDVFTAGKNQKLFQLNKDNERNFNTNRDFKASFESDTEKDSNNTKASNTPQNGKNLFSALICYEAIFPSMAREDVKMGAQLFVNVSNDAWYERTSAARQHLYLSILRSVEQNRFMVRAGNTGISAFIDNYGRIMAQTELFQDATLSGFVKLCNEKTIFFHISPYLLPIALFLFLILCILIYKSQDNIKAQST